LGWNEKVCRKVSWIRMSGEPAVVIFVNRKSGGQRGEAVYKEFEPLLKGRCFYLDQGPTEGLNECVRVLEASEQYRSKLEKFQEAHPVSSSKDDAVNTEFFSTEDVLRVICAGGDGTVAWILSAMDKHQSLPKCVRIPVAHLPLGTGNDFSRATGWGGGYDGGAAAKVIKNVKSAGATRLDRWKMELTKLSTDECETFHFQNYASFGADAATAHGFHSEREKNPHLFTSRTKNKLVYVREGAKVMFSGRGRTLRGTLDVRPSEKGKEITPVMGTLTQSLMILNVPSYAGGADLWGRKGETIRGQPIFRSSPRGGGGSNARPGGFEPQSIGDGLLEGIHMQGIIHAGGAIVLRYTGRRAWQADKVVINGNFPVWYGQVDGEPFVIEDPKGFHAEISLSSVASVLIRSN